MFAPWAIMRANTAMRGRMTGLHATDRVDTVARVLLAHAEGAATARALAHHETVVRASADPDADAVRLSHSAHAVAPVATADQALDARIVAPWRHWLPMARG